jgi:glycosyltransferase involved in cell wall biosynthesis
MLLPPLEQKAFSDLGDPDTVSVVVPSYNHSAYVERALRSIFEQTLQPRSLLVIDDGSRDDSPAVIERALQDAKFPTQFIARSNHGLSATLNEALRLLSSDGRSRYFAYLGSDDVWLPTFLEQRVRLLERRTNAVLAYGNAYSIDADDRIIDCTVDWARYTDGDVREMLLDTIAPLSPTVVYRTAAIRDMSWNENSRLEDYEFYLRLSARGEFAYDPQILSAWRQHGANASDGTQMMLDERIAALDTTAELFKLSSDDLADLRSLVRFRGAQEFMRSGRKGLALKYGLSNIHAARSVTEVVRFVGGLAVPRSRLRTRREKARNIAFGRYGRI